MTEDEARTKWCPLTAHAHPINTRCIASNCAMWTWISINASPPNGRCGLINPTVITVAKIPQGFSR